MEAGAGLGSLLLSKNGIPQRDRCGTAQPLLPTMTDGPLASKVYCLKHRLAGARRGDELIKLAHEMRTPLRSCSVRAQATPLVNCLLSAELRRSQRALPSLQLGHLAFAIPRLKCSYHLAPPPALSTTGARDEMLILGQLFMRVTWVK